jgi:hypothetical protein
LYVIARVELQLSDEQWFDLDYRQFRLLHDRWLTLRWQDQWQRAASISASYRNGMRTYDPVPGPDDFIFTIPPGQRKSAVASAAPVQGRDLVANIFRSLAVRKPCQVTSTSA